MAAVSMARKRHLHQAQGVDFGFCFPRMLDGYLSVLNLWIMFLRVNQCTCPSDPLRL